jgi:hypothetical protein
MLSLPWGRLCLWDPLGLGGWNRDEHPLKLNMQACYVSIFRGFWTFWTLVQAVTRALRVMLEDPKVYHKQAPGSSGELRGAPWSWNGIPYGLG